MEWGDRALSQEWAGLTSSSRRNRSGTGPRLPDFSFFICEITPHLLDSVVTSGEELHGVSPLVDLQPPLRGRNVGVTEVLIPPGAVSGPHVFGQGL